MSILKRLGADDLRVVSFKLSDDGGTINIREECDGYFDYDMSASEFDEFLSELAELRRRMKPPIADKST